VIVLVVNKNFILFFFSYKGWSRGFCWRAESDGKVCDTAERRQSWPAVSGEFVNKCCSWEKPCRAQRLQIFRIALLKNSNYVVPDENPFHSLPKFIPYSTSVCNLNFLKNVSRNLTCPQGKWRTHSTSLRLLNSTFFALSHDWSSYWHHERNVL